MGGVKLYFIFFNYGTINKPLVVGFLHTDPDGKPVGLVGMFVIDKLFTNVVQDLLAEIQDPITKVSFREIILLLNPPTILEQFDNCTKL